jgi:hypothetical protein
MALTGYCKQCKAFVYLREDGSCRAGHPPESISHPEKPKTTWWSSLGSVGKSIVVLLLVGLMSCCSLVTVYLISSGREVASFYKGDTNPTAVINLENGGHISYTATVQNTSQNSVFVLYVYSAKDDHLVESAAETNLFPEKSASINLQPGKYYFKIGVVNGSYEVSVCQDYF